MAEGKKNLDRQIIIEGDPGFVCECDAYSEYMEITPRGIKYKLCPHDKNKKMKNGGWSYKTSSLRFRSTFNKLYKVAVPIVKNDLYLVDIIDAAGVTITIVEDGKIWQKEVTLCSGKLSRLCRKLKKLIPEMEDEPQFMQGSLTMPAAVGMKIRNSIVGRM